MIRRATYADLPRMVELGALFHHYSGLAEIAFDAGSFLKTLEIGIAADNQAYFVAEDGGQVVGMTGGIVYPSYFNHSALTGQEMFWWSEKAGAGRELYRALEAWAASKGCKTFTMIALEDDQSGRMDKIYRRMGYRPAEHSYIKGL